MTAYNETDDSEDLEALFDSIVAANHAKEVQAKPVAALGTDNLAPASTVMELDSPLSEPRLSEAPARSTPVGAPPLRGDLSSGRVSGGVPIAGVRSDISSDRGQRVPSSQPAVLAAQSSDVINQIGHMTRTLHDALRELGLNKKIEKAASSIPDARDRLNYVATLTQQAAERVLNATEAAQPLVEKMEVEAHRLAGQWQMLFEKQLDAEQFKDLARQTHAFLYEVPKQTKATHAYLMEIMMAQDFQDLTSQVIKKIIDITENMEQQLLALLLENAPARAKAESNSGLLDGPVVNPNGRKDVAGSQSRVDELLEDLGF